VSAALGIDIGGTGIKGARVDTATGELLGPRVKYPTPEGGQPGDVVETAQRIIAEVAVDPADPVGVCFPAVVRHGVTMSAANVSSDWIGLAAENLFTQSLGRAVHFVNDADAAGYAEARIGAARNVAGLVVVVTLGTGVGTALISDGVLVPNSELGHLELGGANVETQTSNAVREREGLDFPTWGARLTQYFAHLEKLLSPELFIIGGGISSRHDEFFPYIAIDTPVKPAELRNNAGIVGSALLATLHAQH
jgi:polyphosphate glucokinase